MSRAFYNEIDPYAAQWLRNLIAAGHIAPGDVDERDIRDIRPSDLDGYVQCHFFAGIAGWSRALRLAGWPDDRPVWTGSCPCQPFSSAGRGAGFADERHLWPAWYWLIEQCRPAVVLGEQVASKDGLTWLDLVQADLEGAGYAVGAADLCAAGVGAPHIRQRLWFVADRQQQWFRGARPGAAAGAARGVQGADGDRERLRADARPSDAALVGVVGDGLGTRLEGHPGYGHNSGGRAIEDRPAPEAGATRGFWSDADWLWCRDGKYRPVEPGTFPLAHGVPARVGKLRAYGNAIVPQVAAEFIGAYLDASRGAL